jgi:hypothetical protein
MTTTKQGNCHRPYAHGLGAVRVLEPKQLIYKIAANLLLSTVQLGLARSGLAAFLVSAVWFGAVRTGGITASMTT